METPRTSVTYFCCPWARALEHKIKKSRKILDLLGYIGSIFILSLATIRHQSGKNVGINIAATFGWSISWVNSCMVMSEAICTVALFENISILVIAADTSSRI
jgi:hypothetical protein